MILRNPRFLIISALCGGMGVLSGYAIFLTYWHVTTESTQTRFLLTLLLTAIISYAIEWIREVIREGRIEPAAHPVFRTMGTFLIVLMFELFILGFHTTSDFTLEMLGSVSTKLLGPDVPASANWMLVLAGGLWVAVGALLAAWLSRSVGDIPGTPGSRIYLATRNGIIGGLIFAPVVMALYLFGSRCLFALLGVYHAYGGGDAVTSLGVLWHNIWVSQNSLTHGWFVSAFWFCLLLPLGLLNLAAQKNMAVFMVCFLALAAFAAAYPALLRARRLRSRVFTIVLGVMWVMCVAYTLLPFGDAMVRVVRQLMVKETLTTIGDIFLLAAVLWAVPGALLGALTPLLRRVATHTRNWAFVGYGSALLLMIATAWAHAWWPLVPALAAAAVGYMFQRGSRLSEYWPFAALCVAAGVCGATSIAQHWTFTQEVVNLLKIDDSRSAAKDTPNIADRIRSADQLSPAEHVQYSASSSTGLFTTIHGDDGQLLWVTERAIDAGQLRIVVQAMQTNDAAMKKFVDDATRPVTPPMPAAKDMPPGSSAIDAAVARLRPGATTMPEPAAKPYKSAPPQDPIETEQKMYAEMFGQNPSSVPGTARTQKSEATPLQPHTPPTPAPVAVVPAAPAATVSVAKPTPANPTQEGAATTNPADEEKKVAEALELSLSGSVGFWVTVGLLACWSMEENAETGHPPLPSPTQVPPADSLTG